MKNFQTKIARFFPSKRRRSEAKVKREIPKEKSKEGFRSQYFLYSFTGEGICDHKFLVEEGSVSFQTSGGIIANGETTNTYIVQVSYLQERQRGCHLTSCTFYYCVFYAIFSNKNLIL